MKNKHEAEMKEVQAKLAEAEKALAEAKKGEEVEKAKEEKAKAEKDPCCFGCRRRPVFLPQCLFQLVLRHERTVLSIDIAGNQVHMKMLYRLSGSFSIILNDI